MSVIISCCPHTYGRAVAAGLLALICASGSPTVPAQFCGDVADYDAGCKDPSQSYYEEAWREDKTSLPSMPEDDNLRAIDANRADPRYEYLLDSASISRGGDDVMRYTVVVVSSSGARNIFHEGIRCQTDEVKTYAYASNGSSFRRASRPAWRPLAIRGVRAYQEYLAGVVLCDADGHAWDAKKAVAVLGRQYTAGGVRIRSENCPDCELRDERRND